MLRRIIFHLFILFLIGCGVISNKSIISSDSCPVDDIVELKGIYQYIFERDSVGPKDYFWYKDSKFLDMNTQKEFPIFANRATFNEKEKRKINRANLEVRNNSIYYEPLFQDAQQYGDTMRKVIDQNIILSGNLHFASELYNSNANPTQIVIAFYMEISAFINEKDCENRLWFYNAHMSSNLCPVPANRVTLPFLTLINYDSTRKLTENEIKKFELSKSNIKRFIKRDCSE